MSRETAESQGRVDCFFQRRSLILSVIIMLSMLLGLVILAASVGPGFRPGSRHVIWLILACAALLALIGAFVWVLVKRPVALRISAEGVDLPIVFRHPLPWSDIHRVRRSRASAGIQGKRDWLIIDPSPGVLAPLRLPVWRWLELKWQRYHGVRIPLHGLDAAPDQIVASIERFREVRLEEG